MALHRRPLLHARTATDWDDAGAAARQRWRRTCSPTRRAGRETIDYTRRRSAPAGGGAARSIARERRRGAGRRAAGARRRAISAGSRCRRGDAVGRARRRGARALLEAMARQATLALHQSRLAEQQPARRAAQGGARRAQPHRARHPRHAGAGLRRHPDAAAGGAARRPARCRRAVATSLDDRGRPRPHAHDRGAPLGRRAAAARRTTAEDISAGAAAHGRHWRGRTTDVPIELTVDELPTLRRRRRARDHRHRAGGADQRRRATRAPGASPIQASAPRVGRLPPVGGRRWPRHRARSAATPASA